MTYYFPELFTSLLSYGHKLAGKLQDPLLHLSKIHKIVKGNPTNLKCPAILTYIFLSGK